MFLAWLERITRLEQTCVVGMEGANGNGRQLCSFLMPKYQEIYEVNPIQTKQRRDHNTSRDKSDPIDAMLIIEVLTRKLDKLPRGLPIRIRLKPWLTWKSLRVFTLI